MNLNIYVHYAPQLIIHTGTAQDLWNFHTSCQFVEETPTNAALPMTHDISGYSV
jgi:hypothetical protein